MTRIHTTYTNLESLKIEQDGNELRVVYSTSGAVIGILGFIMLYAAFLYVLAPIVYSSESYMYEFHVRIFSNLIFWGTPTLVLSIFTFSLIKQLKINKPYLVLNFSEKKVSVPRSNFSAPYSTPDSKFLHKVFMNGENGVSEFNFLHEGKTEVPILHSAGHSIFYSKLRKKLNSIHINCEKISIKE